MSRFKDSVQEKGTFKNPDTTSRYKHPVFCFRNVQTGFELSEHDKNQMKRAIKKLERWASLTWNDIIQTPREGNGHEIISLSSINVSVPLLARSEKILSTRYNGTKCRLIGFKDSQDVFNILWFDKDLNVYDH